MLLVSAAALLAVGAGVALVLGWSTNDATLAWTCVAASVLAGILLAVATRSDGAPPPGGDRE